MRLLELHVRNVRGIKAADLIPAGQNLVVWGPNGSGKSAVVDAVDFLLTGRISRLIGEGTGGITLQDHGPHVDHEAKDASVSALLSIPGYKSPILVSRSLSAPKTLECPSEARVALAPVLALAAKGQHVLSRRQILKYIAAEPSKRATEVQAILDLSDLEDVRKAVTKASNQAKVEHAQAKTRLTNAQDTITTTLALHSFDEGQVLTHINALRRTLSVEPLTRLDPASLKSGVTAVNGAGTAAGPDPMTLRNAHRSLARLVDTPSEVVEAAEYQLRRQIGDIRRDESAVNAFKRHKLLTLGVSLIPSDGTCPLCDTAWPAGDLQRHIQEHIDTADAVAKSKRGLIEHAEVLRQAIESAVTAVERLLTAAVQLKLEEPQHALEGWCSRLKTLGEQLLDPLDGFDLASHSVDNVTHLYASSELLASALSVVTQAESSHSQRTPQQDAWDTLTRLEANLKEYEPAKLARTDALLTWKRAEIVASRFEQSRDSVVLSLYNTVRARFEDFYRTIHSDDESTFESTLKPDGAGLLLEVDFHNRGPFPPLAMHSEGHQDTMGICLYFALAERLIAGSIDLIVLDDVVMSVDSEHRRQICKLLIEQFPDRQFLITTHDRTWARQLRTTGVVPLENSIEFSNWTIDTGPRIRPVQELSKHIDHAIDDGQIPSAAHLLRRGAEEFFDSVCDSLRASVRYRSDGRYELGDLVLPAVKAYRAYLKLAKASAGSWRKQDDVDRVTELETVAAQIVSRAQLENWGINENVHYSHWPEFTAGDFRPVAETWRDLFSMFRCGGACKSQLYVTETPDGKPSELRCNCKAVSWNLEKAPEASTESAHPRT